MKKVIIKNKQEVNTHGAEMLDPTEWIAYCVANNLWGLPERIVDDVEGSYDPADVIEHINLIVVEAVPAVLISESVPAVLDEQGNVVTPEVPAVYSEEVPAVIKKQVKLKAEYTIEVIDITAQVEQEKTNAEALAYLASTDWMIIREIDSGLPCPQNVKTERAAARARIVK